MILMLNMLLPFSIILGILNLVLMFSILVLDHGLYFQFKGLIFIKLIFAIVPTKEPIQNLHQLRL